MLPWLHANEKYLKCPGNNGRGWKSEHGQTTTDGEHLIQLQQVGALHGPVWSGLSWSDPAHRLTQHQRHLTDTFLIAPPEPGAVFRHETG